MFRASQLQVFLALAVTGIVVAIFGPSFWTYLVAWIALAAVLGASFRFGMLIGELNMALAAFYAIGAYAAAVATVQWQLPFVVSLAFSLVLVAAVSTAFGFATMRIKGPYFMLIGFAFSELVRLLLSRADSLGGNSGIVGIFPPRWLGTYMPATLVVMVLLLIGILMIVEQSRYGKIFAAILHNDALARSVGIRVLRTKVFCLALSSIAAGLAGGLFGHLTGVVSPGDFTFLVPIFALAAVKIGGEASYLGPILGAVLLSLLGQYVLQFGQLESIFYGVAIMIATLLMPGGIHGVLFRLRILPGEGRRAD
jgi:branched-chain amino acid transport system permease protein